MLGMSSFWDAPMFFLSSVGIVHRGKGRGVWNSDQVDGLAVWHVLDDSDMAHIKGIRGRKRAVEENQCFNGKAKPHGLLGQSFHPFDQLWLHINVCWPKRVSQQCRVLSWQELDMTEAGAEGLIQPAE